MKRSGKMHNYRTAPLIDYDPAYQDRAKFLYSAVAAELNATHRATAEKGSYSFTRRTGGVEAKVVILEKGLSAARMSKEMGWWPSGVYICTIPLLPIVNKRSEGEVGIAPNHDSGFEFYLVKPDEDLEALAGAVKLAVR